MDAQCYPVAASANRWHRPPRPFAAQVLTWALQRRNSYNKFDFAADPPTIDSHYRSEAQAWASSSSATPAKTRLSPMRWSTAPRPSVTITFWTFKAFAAARRGRRESTTPCAERGGAGLRHPSRDGVTLGIRRDAAGALFRHSTDPADHADLHATRIDPRHYAAHRLHAGCICSCKSVSGLWRRGPAASAGAMAMSSQGSSVNWRRTSANGGKIGRDETSCHKRQGTRRRAETLDALLAECVGASVSREVVR